MPADAPLRPSLHLQPPEGQERVVYALLAVVAVVVAVGMLVFITSIGMDPARRSAGDATASRGPSFWTVRRGQTLAQIAERTGLSISELEEFNPTANPSAIVPGQRLKLRKHVPPPPPKPKGPRFWRVRSGESFASISARSGRSVSRLRTLNPGVKAAALRPGDRLRLRR